ncbi:MULTISPECIES: hypothetical protein [Thermococcus]|uniref:Putative archaeal membrane protein n=1 Tax=Thermococcus nautili TaxID=195522 RepID=W8PI02_9EURY|nr:MULTISPECIES: hypothetical protein [Thermococcus]AHL21724.1 putative archaeal membrane protein [Thermococcus nautili]NJE49029.1 hypothetical protein [Thermococcus sp. 9N3]
MKLPALVPVLFMTYVAVGLAEPKTLAVSLVFALAILFGIRRGDRVEWRDLGFEIDERYVNYAFWIAIGIILYQVIRLGNIPLLHPAIRTHLNPRLTALTYFLGVPASVYLFIRGKRYALLYPVAVSLYAYRTPVLVSIIAIGSAYYESAKGEGKLDVKKLAGILAGGAGLFLLITFLRGNTLSSLWVRFQSTVSALDVIIWRGDWSGTYGGQLQWAGVASYIWGGYSPRGLIAKFLYVHTGATITATLLGGMYLDFGIFAVIEGFLLGLYYGAVSKATHPTTRALYYSTLAYGIVGVETGILDLPVYVLFLLGAYAVYKGWKVMRKREAH